MLVESSGEIHTSKERILVKRAGNLYGLVCDYENLKLAHRNAKKGKGWYEEVKFVERDLRKNLMYIKDLLESHEYKTSEYKMFYKQEGDKLRKIYKLPYFPDRIVQWALMQVVSPYIRRHLIFDTYSAIPKRGIHSGLERVQEAMYRHRDECEYCLKFDVRHYYQNISHEILYGQYERIFKDANLLWLIREIIDSISTIDEEDFEELDRLGLPIDSECGVPIGNYFSQWSGNFYLSGFDHWMKESMGLKYYFRYMDDIVVLHSDKGFLHDLCERCREYLWDNLRLRLKNSYQVFPSYVRGVDFLGYRIFDGYTLLRKKSAKSIKGSCNKIGRKVANGNMMSFSDFCSLNSHLGWAEKADCYRFLQRHIMPFEESASNFYLQVIWMEGKK